MKVNEYVKDLESSLKTISEVTLKGSLDHDSYKFNCGVIYAIRSAIDLVKNHAEPLELSAIH